MPSNFNFTTDDFELILGGILNNAKAYKIAKDDKERDKYQKNIDKLKLYIERAIPQSNSSNFWKKKFNAYLSEAALIMGKDINDPMILLQLAEEKKNDNKFEEAILLYEKALAGRIVGSDRLSKKPNAYMGLAECAIKLEKNDLGIKAMRNFFAEFPPSDPKYKGLQDLFIRGSKLYFKLANKIYSVSKTDEDKKVLMDSLDILEKFNPEGVIFTKIDALTAAGNFIDSIKLAESVKKESIDFDKALYYKALAQFNYANDVKIKNNGVHNELSLKMTTDSKASFLELLNFMKTDPTDIIQGRRDLRKIWEKEATRLIAFLHFSLEDYKNAIDGFIALNEEYKKSPDGMKHANRLMVLQNMFIAYDKLYNLEKDPKAKQELMGKCDSVYKELKTVDVNAFLVKASTRTPEERKTSILSNFHIKLAMMQISNPLKDPKITAEGVSGLGEETKNKGIENMDLFLGRKFLELKDFEKASICLGKVFKS